MTNRGIDIKIGKQRGEWAELRFMTRAAEHGLSITKPCGEMSHYDFAIEHQGHFVRVQVKSTKYKRRHSYPRFAFALWTDIRSLYANLAARCAIAIAEILTSAVAPHRLMPLPSPC